MTWPEIEIGKVAAVESGFGFPRDEQGNAGEEFPFFKVGDMNLPGNERCMVKTVNTISAITLSKLKAKALPKGTVVFPKIGAAIATNKKRMLTQPSVVDNNIMGLIPTSHVNEWYLFYWMQQFDLRKVTNIGPVPSMRKTEVERVLIPLPPLSEQRRIVEILDQADALRKRRAESDAKAARILPSLFYKMFGDPATNPKMWPVVSGEEIFEKIGYGVGSPPPFSDKGIPFLRAGNIKPEGIKRENMVFFETKYKSSIARSEVHVGDIVIVRRGAYTGDCVVIPEAFDGAFVGYDLICHPNSDTNPYWFAAAWNFPTIWQRIENIRKRAAQQGLNKDQIASFELPRPPKQLQDSFAEKASLISSSNLHRKKAFRTTEKIFAVLLHRAFTGELTAKWREVHMKDLLREMEEQSKVLEAFR